MVMWMLMVAAVWLARVLPLRVSYALARSGATLGYWLWPGGRRRCIENMSMVTGGNERLARRYARRSFGNYGVFLVDFLRAIRTTPEDVRRRVVFDRWEELEAQRAGKGIVFVTMHFGNWDLGAAALSQHGFPITAVADEFAHPRIDAMVRRSREALGMTVLPAGRMGPGILRALRRNDVIAALADVPAPPGGGVEVEFFGERIVVPDGIARIALRSGASVVVGMLHRQSGWSDVVEGWIAPVPFTPSGDSDADTRALTQAIFRGLEPLVSRAPDQWYIFRSLHTRRGEVDRPAQS